jgi:Secretion system C-terminal sorting domain
MKKLFILVPLLSIAVFCTTLNFNKAYSHESGGDAGFAGVPSIGGGETCGSGTGCHANASAVSTTGINVSSTVPSAGYIAGSTYTVTIIANAPAGFTAPVIGFSATPRKANGTLAGVMVVTNSTRTKLNGTAQYATHKFAGIPATANSNTFSFDWTAPVAGSGAITLYVATIYGNGDGSENNDRAGKTNISIPEASSVGLNNATIALSNLYIYNNKDKNAIQVNFDLVNSSKTYISVIDINGKIVSKTERYDLTSGKNEIALNTNSFSKGVYLVNIAMENALPISRKVLID